MENKEEEKETSTALALLVFFAVGIGLIFMVVGIFDFVSQLSSNVFTDSARLDALEARLDAPDTSISKEPGYCHIMLNMGSYTVSENCHLTP